MIQLCLNICSATEILHFIASCIFYFIPGNFDSALGHHVHLCKGFSWLGLLYSSIEFKISLSNTHTHTLKAGWSKLPVLTNSLMRSSFIRMVTESSLIFCWARSNPLSEPISHLQPLRLSSTELSPTLLLAIHTQHSQTIRTQRCELLHAHLSNIETSNSII